MSKRTCAIFQPVILLFSEYISCLETDIFASSDSVSHLIQGRIKGGGNCPGPPAARGLPVMKFISFKLNICLKNFRDSEVMQEYNSNLIFLRCFKHEGPQQKLVSLRV